MNMKMNFKPGDQPEKTADIRDATTGFPAKMTSEKAVQKIHTGDPLGSASDWLKQIPRMARPIKSTTQIWVVTRHQYTISELVSQTSFHGETNSGIVKCQPCQ